MPGRGEQGAAAVGKGSEVMYDSGSVFTGNMPISMAGSMTGLKHLKKIEG
jgi:hypothetical protein